MPVPIPTFRPAASATEELEQKHAIVSAWLANVREDLAHRATPTLELGERNLREVLATIEASILALN